MPSLLQEQLKETDQDEKPTAAALPKGVVLGKDGKPCKSCTSSSAWMAMMKQSTTTKPVKKLEAVETTAPSECPPDVEQLGNASWTLLHSLTANYPEQPDTTRQKKTSTFLHLFSQLYPCWVCAEDFQEWMKDPTNDPDQNDALKTPEGFGRWMCRAHNAVNVKLGKKEFDCNLWRERWKDGWKDGRCD